MSVNTSPPRSSLARVNHLPSNARLTYRDLIDFHIGNLRQKQGGERRRIGIINNYMTAINQWLEYATWMQPQSQRAAVSPSALIGAEMGDDFRQRLIDHLVELKNDKLARSTINNRKSLLSKWRESYFLLKEVACLPEGFGAALDALLEKGGRSISQVARSCNTSVSTLLRWRRGETKPNSVSLRYVTALEGYFGLPVNTLLLKAGLSAVPSSTPDSAERRTTPHRRYVSELRNKPYKLAAEAFNDRQRQEWQDLFRFYTNHAWVAAQGLERSRRGWRTRRNDQKNSTGEMKLRFLQNFYGYLCLPSLPELPAFHGVEFDPENGEHRGVRGLDPHLVGMGIDPEKLSLALFVDTNLIHGHIEFLRRRAFGHVYNTYVRGFLNFCRQLVLPAKGFLWQHARFGVEAQPPILSDSAWRERCEEAHRRIKNIIRNLESSEDESEKFRQSRDTSLRVVRPLIREREHPISVLMDITEGLRRAFNLSRTPASKAVLFRNMVMVELLTSNPMRAINMVEMRYIKGSKGNEEDPVNLYKIADGSYRLKYEVWELKNGAHRGRYDLPVSAELTQDLDEYLEIWRPLLAGARDCHYVFRPALNKSAASRRSGSDGQREKSVRPLAVNYFSRIINSASKRFIPNCAGFGPHAVRHFVATEWLKFNPSAYAVAAAILHDSEKVVKEAYAWVTPNDIIPFWMHHLGRVVRHSRRDRGR
jgi:transcriptional regulator with XRE-family HTH domain